MKPSNFRLPQHCPNKLDRITLIATGTMKAHEIGDEVRYCFMSILCVAEKCIILHVVWSLVVLLLILINWKYYS